MVHLQNYVELTRNKLQHVLSNEPQLNCVAQEDEFCCFAFNCFISIKCLSHNSLLKLLSRGQRTSGKY